MGVVKAPTVLIVDNHDSFTYTIAHLVASVTGSAPTVILNDALPATDDAALADQLTGITHLIIGPGPGTPHTPADVGISTPLLRLAGERGIPVLGICLGLQLMAVAEGGTVSRAPEPRHGLESTITHFGDPLFAGVPSPVTVVRYHSLAITTLPETLEATAHSEDGVIQAVRHRTLPFAAVQFHPESIRSQSGRQIMANFLGLDLPDGAGADAADIGARCPRGPLTAPDDPTHRLSIRGPLPLTADPSLLFRAEFAHYDTAVWLDSNSHDARASLSVMGALCGPDSHALTYRIRVDHPAAEYPDAEHPGADHPGADHSSSERPSTVHRCAELRFENGRTEQFSPRDLADAIRRCRDRVRVAPHPPSAEPLPRAFTEFQLGYVGSLGYGLKADTLGVPDERASRHPDAMLLFLQRALVIDHRERTVWAAELTPMGEPASDWLEQTHRRLEQLLREGDRSTAVAPACGEQASPAAPEHAVRPAPVSDSDIERAVRFRHPEAEYIRLIQRCQELIDQGESYELCLTNHAEVDLAALDAESPVDPLAVYERLRTIAKVPFGALLRFGQISVLSASPERFLELTADGHIESRPIKGTARRGATPEEDEQLKAALAGSEKERAENLMIVDLVRNDLARVSELGSVHVPALFEIESFETVHQMISTVRGTLRSDLDALDAIHAAFPGGSMTGAPKLRSVQLLDALEQGPRGIYSGAIGWLSTNGALSLGMVIRTLVIDDRSVFFGVGGAITRLSDPMEEYVETLVKSRTVVSALLPPRA